MADPERRERDGKSERVRVSSSPNFGYQRIVLTRRQSENHKKTIKTKEPAHRPRPVGAPAEPVTPTCY